MGTGSAQWLAVLCNRGAELHSDRKPGFLITLPLCAFVRKELVEVGVGGRSVAKSHAVGANSESGDHIHVHIAIAGDLRVMDLHGLRLEGPHEASDEVPAVLAEIDNQR